MTRVEIRTGDAAWDAANGTPGRDGRVVVAVPAVERLTFAGRSMVRFDIRTVARKMPRGYANPHTMVPAVWVV